MFHLKGTTLLYSSGTANSAHLFDCVIVITTSWPVHGSFEDTSEKKRDEMFLQKNDNKIKINFFFK